jgi:glycosyltransferase involved in cell wall biosynthesis
MRFSVVIATYNRSRDLEGTLASLAGMRPRGDWEVIVVDNNSTDDTRQVVEGAAPAFPVDLRYVFEKQQGRSPALNAGIRAARGEIIATTDDDVRVDQPWLDRAAEALESIGCDYVGGRVLPIWGGPCPAWLANRPGKQWAVIALLDYGPRPLEFGTRVPLGVNMAFRRHAFDRAGLFDVNTGRRAGTLLGQEVREWCIRARAAGLRGFYIPEMTVHHIIPASRLNKAYFRRWFFWRGISRAQLYERFGLDMIAPEETTLDYGRVPHVAGVPRFMYRQCLQRLVAWSAAKARRRAEAAFEHELWLCFFAGVLKQRVVTSRGARPRTAAGAQEARC